MTRELVLLLGGRSEIGLETTRRLVAAGTRTVVLAARGADDLADEAASLRSAAGAPGAPDAPGTPGTPGAPDAAPLRIETVEFDADDLAGHPAFVDDVLARFGVPAVVLVCFGILGDQARAERDAAHAVAIAHTDYVAQISLLTLLADRSRAAGRGRLVVFSSVAGIRVRRANYVYGSAKAGLDGFALGLADGLHGSGAGLLLVRPGFVVGRMTAGMAPAPFASTPAQVAAAVVRALDADRAVIWVPPLLRWVFGVARLVPRPVWRRLPR